MKKKFNRILLISFIILSLASCNSSKKDTSVLNSSPLPIDTSKDPNYSKEDKAPDSTTDSNSTINPVVTPQTPENSTTKPGVSTSPDVEVDLGLELENEIPQNTKSPGSSKSQSVTQKTTINPYHPIIVAFRNDSKKVLGGIVLGGSKGKKWYKYSDFAMSRNGKKVTPQDYIDDISLNETVVDVDLAKGNESYTFYGLTESVAKTTGGRPTFSVDGYGNDLMSIVFKSFQAEDTAVIGINGEWNGLPRTPETLSKESVSVDMEGDGTKETLTYFKTVPRDEDFAPNAYKVNVNINKGENKIPVTNFVVDGVYTSSYTVHTLDLNGDGKLEIIIIKRGHNLQIDVYEINKKAANVLSFYMGDWFISTIPA